jgi:RimJ/RimL family protein N-acetyltransferase
VLGSRSVRLEPIEPDLARSMLAGSPGTALAWEEGFPMPPVLEFARTIAVAAEPLGPFAAFVIIRVRDGLAVGDAGFHGPPNEDGEVEIGYAVVPLARGAGIGREAARLLVSWALSQPAVRAVTARVEAGNTASERLLNSLGFKVEGKRDGMTRFVLRAL